MFFIYGPPAIAGLSSLENPPACCLDTHFPRLADFVGHYYCYAGHDGDAPDPAKEIPDTPVCLDVYDYDHIQLDSALHSGHVPYQPGPDESDGFDPLFLISGHSTMYWLLPYTLKSVELIWTGWVSTLKVQRFWTN